MEPVTRELFEEWTTHPVTRKFFKTLVNEREDMKEGLVNGIYEVPDLVRGRCQAIALILDITYEALFDEPKRH